MGQQQVTVKSDGEVAVVEICNPPINALSGAVRKMIWDELHTLFADHSVKAIVLACAPPTFSGGADLNEFGKPPMKPGLSELIDMVEAAEKPIVAALFGTAYGGGLEIALGCHYRVGVKNVRLALPEVKLGLIPGAGGTQRLPRLIGPVASLAPIAIGDPVGGEEALKLGLLDKIVEGDLTKGAITFAREHTDIRPLRRVSEMDEKLEKVRQNDKEFEIEISRILTLSRGTAGPTGCIRSVRNSLVMDFKSGSVVEREIFYSLRDGGESRALRYQFFAERSARKVIGVRKETTSSPIERTAVIGAGTMGRSIALILLVSGYHVVLIDIDKHVLKQAEAFLRNTLGKSNLSKKLDGTSVDKILSQLTVSEEIGNVVHANLIIESVGESLSLKKKIFDQLGRLVGPTTILATNTSSLNIDEIAQEVPYPENVLGMHFSTPAHVMPLLEIVHGSKTTPETLKTAMAVAKKMGKVPVTVGVCRGFVGNRMLASRSRQVEKMLLEGVHPSRIDQVATSFGFAMGPCAISDKVGLDVVLDIRNESGESAPIVNAIVQAGRLGRKTGSGYYQYHSEEGAGVEDDETCRLINELSQSMGIKQRDLQDDEIKDRLIFSIINEGAKILEEGIATRCSDIDVIWVKGHGFPATKGGPMYFADQMGISNACKKLNLLSELTNDRSFEPAKLLLEYAESGDSICVS